MILAFHLCGKVVVAPRTSQDAKVKSQSHKNLPHRCHLRSSWFLNPQSIMSDPMKYLREQLGSLRWEVADTKILCPLYFATKPRCSIHFLRSITEISIMINWPKKFYNFKCFDTSTTTSVSSRWPWHFTSPERDVVETTKPRSARGENTVTSADKKNPSRTRMTHCNIIVHHKTWFLCVLPLYSQSFTVLIYFRLPLLLLLRLLPI